MASKDIFQGTKQLNINANQLFFIQFSILSYHIQLEVCVFTSNPPPSSKIRRQTAEKYKAWRDSKFSHPDFFESSVEKLRVKT